MLEQNRAFNKYSNKKNNRRFNIGETMILTLIVFAFAILVLCERIYNQLIQAQNLKLHLEQINKLENDAKFFKKMMDKKFEKVGFMVTAKGVSFFDDRAN